MESSLKDSKMEPEPEGLKLDFNNTEIAFSYLTNKELKKTAWLFRRMKSTFLVNAGSFFVYWGVKLRIPFVETIIKKTIFRQFCGGETLMDCQSEIDKLYKYDALTILDYGAEGKSTEEELNGVRDEILRAIEMAASNDSVPVISTKVSGLANNELLEKVQSNHALTDGEKFLFERLKERLDTICERAEELGVGVFIDAEESWIQDAIDRLVYDLMDEYNKDEPIVYNTYQLYRKDTLAKLKRDHQIAVENGYFLGAKLVRGAYMDKERARAEEKGYPDPINPTKADTDREYNDAIRYCMDHYLDISSCCASHNIQSNRLQAEIIVEKGLDPSHKHFNFSQLYGMSDFISFNLANAGFNVAKYLPYGPVKEVIPYLLRRARENTSVTGEMGRELSYVESEKRRRGLS